MPEPDGDELALQRRWAESRWPTPFLLDRAGDGVRVIWPGRWNRGPGPDFRGAQVLDGDGRAQRGDVEVHMRADAWLQHGHSDDPAYRDLVLHLVDWNGRPARGAAPLDPRIPGVTPLPPPLPVPRSLRWAETTAGGAPAVRSRNARKALPCVGIRERAGAAAVEARLRAIARRRFGRKARELWTLEAPEGPGGPDDRRAVIAAARALGQPHNAGAAEAAARAALAASGSWSEVAPTVGSDGWRRGRGALGSASGLSRILTTLVRRWSTPPHTPWTSVERLAGLPRREAVAELRISGQLGAARATQLLADAVYPLVGAEAQWSLLPGVRYQRTDELRERLGGAGDGRAGVSGDGFSWKHPHTQALLELEQTRCRHGACRICPLAGLEAALRASRVSRASQAGRARRPG